MKKRRLERKLTTIVDGNGRATAESLINTQFRELLEDISEVVSRAVRRNPDNPYAVLGVDKSSMRQMADTLLKLYNAYEAISPGQKLAKRTAVSSLKRTLTRLDVCYLASVTNLAERTSQRLGTLTDAVRNGLRASWTDESATPKAKQRKFTHMTAAESRRLREDAKFLNGKRLQVKVLNLVDRRLRAFIEDDPSLAKELGENAVRLSNAIHSVVKVSVDAAVKELAENPVISAKELHNVVYQQLAPNFGQARNFTKVASRAVVSGTLNLAIVDEVERLVNEGTVIPADFYSNRPSFVYKAVMDMRTSEICRTLNGLIIPLEDRSRLLRYLPPQHPNCRSILIPNFRPVE